MNTQPDALNVAVILGSTRQGRFADKPGNWVLQHLQRRDNVSARTLDLRNFPMPFFDQPVPPAMPGRAPYTHEVVQRWTAEIARTDAFVFVTGEYNYGPPAVLKNALDWVYPEWNRKAAAFVSYGGSAGVRAVQQLRESAVELQLASVRTSVHVPREILWTHFQGGDVGSALTALDAQADLMISDLLWWAGALRAARAMGQEA